MRRREFIALVGGAAATWPFVTLAQQQPVVGLLCGVSPDPFAQRLAAIRQGLKDNGFIEGQNVAIEYRWAEDKFERLPALAEELVMRRVALIIAFPDVSVMAAKAATN